MRRLKVHTKYVVDMRSRDGFYAESFFMCVDMVKHVRVIVLRFAFLLRIGRQGCATVHAMIEMHGRYVVDMRSRGGFYAESFLCFYAW